MTHSAADSSQTADLTLVLRLTLSETPNRVAASCDHRNHMNPTPHNPHVSSGHAQIHATNDFVLSLSPWCTYGSRRREPWRWSSWGSGRRSTGRGQTTRRISHPGTDCNTRRHPCQDVGRLFGCLKAKGKNTCTVIKKNLFCDIIYTF